MNITSKVYKFIKENKKDNRVFLIGIDGPGGVGKTTFANQISLRESGVHIVHMDDFDLPNNGKIMGDPNEKEIGQDTDWRRLLSEVIKPLKEDKKAIYKPFDRELGTFGNTRVIKPNGVVIIEGVFSIRKELKNYYDLTLFLNCSFETRLNRVITRDGEDKRDRWERDWFPMEERYIKSHEPEKYADFVINSEALV